MGVNDMDIRRIRRLLSETARLSEHASLTGSLEKGSKLGIRQYNAIREHLQEIGAIPEDLFPDLDEDECGFDELGVATKLLETYLEDEEPEETPRREERKHRHVHIGFGGQGGFVDLKNLGEIIRTQLPEILWEYRQTPPTPPTPPEPPTPPTPPPPPMSADRIAALQALAQRLRDEELSEAERTEIANEIARLIQEPSEAL